MSRYNLDVLSAQPTAHSMTLAILLSASICLFFWYTRRQRSYHSLSKSFAQPSGDAFADLSAPVAIEAAFPGTKKRIKAQELKKEAKMKKRLARREAEAAAAVATSASSFASQGDSASTQRSTDVSQGHVHLKKDLEPRPSPALQSGVFQQAASALPRVSSPSPSETTTATNTTGVTLQSSTLVLTPPPTALPPLSTLPKHQGEVPGHAGASLGEHHAHEEDTVVRLDVDYAIPTQPDDQQRLHVNIADEAQSSTSNDLSTPTDIPVATPNKSKRKNKPKALNPPIPSGHDGLSTTRTPKQQASTSPQPSSQRAEKLDAQADAGSSRATSTKVVEKPVRASPRSRPSSSSHGSSGGVGLGIPSSSSPRTVFTSRSSPSLSPLPPRHRRRHQEQPGQPLQQPYPSLTLNGFVHPMLNQPASPGLGLPSPTPISPSVFPVNGSPVLLNHGTAPAIVYPRAIRPPALPSPLQGPRFSSGAQFQQFNHQLPPVSPLTYECPSCPVDAMSPLVQTGPPEAESSDAEPSFPTLTPLGIVTTTSSIDITVDEDEKDDDVETEDDSFDDSGIISFPTLNPKPNTPRRVKRKRKPDFNEQQTGSEQRVYEYTPEKSNQEQYALHPPSPAGIYLHHHFLQTSPLYLSPHQHRHTSSSRNTSASASPSWPNVTLPLDGSSVPELGVSMASLNNTKGKGREDETLGVLSPSNHYPHTTSADIHHRALSRSSTSSSSTSSYSLPPNPGTITPNSVSSTNPSPRIPHGHLHPMAIPQPGRPPLTPTSNYSPLQPPQAPFMRPGSTPSPIPMIHGWLPAQGTAGNYFPSSAGLQPHPSWSGRAADSPAVGLNGVVNTTSASTGPAARSRSSSPFVGNPKLVTPPPVGYSPFYSGHPYPPMASPLSPLTMGGVPPGPSAFNNLGGIDRHNALPGLPQLQPRSRKNTSSSVSATSPDEDDDVSVELMEAILKNPESMRGSSVSSGRSSRAGSQSVKALSDTGGSENASEDGSSSPTDVEVRQ